MENLKIRKGTFSDLPIIKELISEMINVMTFKDNLDAKVAIKNYNNILRNQNSYILLAEVDNKIVGFINFSIRQTLLHKGSSSIIDELIVTNDFQNKEIGCKLLDAAVEECKNFGCCEIEVSTKSSNISALKFYKKYGFDEKGIFLEKDF